MYYVLPNVRGKQIALVAEDVRSPVVAQALALCRVLCLSPRVKVGSNAGGGRVRGRMQSRRCVAGGVNIVHCGRDAAGVVGSGAARCRSPGRSTTDSMRPTTLSIPAIRHATGVAAYATDSSTITTRLTSTAAQNGATTALDTHVVQNTDGLVRRHQLRHSVVAPQVERNMKAPHQDAKQALHVLADVLLEAIERRLLLGGRMRVRRDQESTARVNPIDEIVGQRASVSMYCVGLVARRPPTASNFGVQRTLVHDVYVINTARGPYKEVPHRQFLVTNSFHNDPPLALTTLIGPRHPRRTLVPLPVTTVEGADTPGHPPLLVPLHDLVQLVLVGSAQVGRSPSLHNEVQQQLVRRRNRRP